MLFKIVQRQQRVLLLIKCMGRATKGMKYKVIIYEESLTTEAPQLQSLAQSHWQ